MAGFEISPMLWLVGFQMALYALAWGLIGTLLREERSPMLHWGAFMLLTGGTLNFRINNGATATAYREATAPGDVVLFADTYNGANPPTTTNITVTEAVTPAAVTVNNSAVSYTFGGTVGIGGTTSLTKSGTGSR